MQARVDAAAGGVHPRRVGGGRADRRLRQRHALSLEAEKIKVRAEPDPTFDFATVKTWAWDDEAGDVLMARFADRKAPDRLWINEVKVDHGISFKGNALQHQVGGAVPVGQEVGFS